VSSKCFADRVAVDVAADALADLAGGRSVQAPALRVDRALDLGEQALGRLQQLLAPLPALVGDVRVAADDEPLAGEVRAFDLG
jgi:hypothetical protein